MTTFQNVILSLVVKQLNSCFLQQLVTLLLQAKNAKNLVFDSSNQDKVDGIGAESKINNN